MNYTDLTLKWLQQNSTLIHYFGLGFIQVKINSTHRIHFYTEQLPPITADEDVHNHRYDFHSSIIFGEFVQEIFQVIDGSTHVLEEESCKEDVHTSSTPQKCSIERLSLQTFSSGSSYHISHHTFHRVRAQNAITFLTRGDIAKENARVIRPVGTSKICPFGKKIPEAELWSIVGTMLTK